MALAYIARGVSRFSQRAGLKPAGIRAQSHCAAHGFDSDQVAQLEDHRMRSVVVELGRVRAFKPAHISRELDCRALHAKTYSEVRRQLAASVVDSAEHSGDASLAEPAR